MSLTPVRALGALVFTVGAGFFGAAVVPSVALGQSQYVLSDFNGTGFQWTWGDLTQTLGGASVRLRDTTDGWGGAGVSTGGINLSAYSGRGIQVSFTPEAANAIDRFEIELIEQSSPAGVTLRSGKWQFEVGALPAGVPVTLSSLTPLSAPLYGEGDYQNLNLANITAWQVLGQYGSTSPFDIRFDRIAVGAPAAPYPGAEPNAPWRATAAQRIDALRKADLAVNVVDRSGAPIPGAAVSVAMQRHEFGFGSAVPASRLRDNSPQHATFKAKVVELFNLATLENDLKWPAWEGEWGPDFSRAGTNAALNWLDARDIDVRGHTLVWPGRDNLPADLQAMLSDNNLTPTEQQAVRNRIASHISQITGAVGSRAVAWDVINETRTNRDLMDRLPEGNQAMVTWFQQAHAGAPTQDLYINDYGILPTWPGGQSQANRDLYYDTIRYLLDQGAPIDGVGFQGHFSASELTGPEELWSVLDRFNELGLKMQVTEFDYDTTDEALQAQYTHDFLTAMFAHEGIDDFLMWGFWEGAHWRPNAAMFRQDWSLKPNGQAYLDLVFDDWWTDADLVAAADGTAQVRGFKGDYEVTVAAGSHSLTLDAALSDGGANLTVTLPVLLGDYNLDGMVDAADYNVWRMTRGSTTILLADGNFDGVVSDADYLVWASRFGATALPAVAVPEPATLTLLVTTFLMASRRGRLR